MWNLFKFTIQISTFVALVTWPFVLYRQSIETQNALRIIIKHELDLQVLHKLVVVKQQLEILTLKQKRQNKYIQKFVLL